MKKTPRIIVLALTVAVLPLKAQHPEKQGDNIPEINHLVSGIKKYVNSFKGKSLADIRKIFKGSKPVERVWKDHGFPEAEGREVTVTFPEYQLLIYMIDDEVLMVSLQILAD